MSTPGVSVSITAFDETAAALASAQARVQHFQQASAGSFKEAHAAARLFSDELGIHLNRELTNILSRSELLKGALSAALPIAGAVGFIEVAARIPDAIAKMSDAMMGFGEASKKSMADAVAANEAYYKSFKTIAEGYGMLAALHKQQDEAQQKSIVPTGPNSWAKNLIGPAGGVWDLASTALDNWKKKQEEIAKLSEHQLTIIQHTGEVQTKNNDDAEKAAEKAAAEAQRARNEWLQSIDAASKASTAFLGKGDSPAQKELSAISEQLATWYKISQAYSGINEIANRYSGELLKQKTLIEAQEASAIATSLRQAGRKSFGDLVSGNSTMPTYTGSAQAMDLLKLQTDQNASWAAARDILASLETPMQQYNSALDGMNELLAQGKISVAQFDAAAAKASDILNKKDLTEAAKEWHQLGSEIGKNLESAVTFQESWSQAFKSILDDIAKAILQFYVFRSLSESFGGSGAGGTFLGNLFGGMAGISGKAGGGGVNAGMSYLVGERGPELFTPGSSGAITPNGALGGQTIYQDFRGAVVTDDLMRRGEALAREQATEKRAVARSMASMTDLRARR